MRKLFVLLAALILGSAAANATSVTVSITVVSTPAAAISCNVTGTFTAPFAGAVCPIVVSPSSWNGTVSLSGPNAGSFTFAPPAAGDPPGTLEDLIVPSTAPLAVGSYSVTLTPTP